MADLSLTDFAKRRGVSKMAVSRAVKSGRLRQCVTRNDRGQPRITDPELADQEWDANTDLTKAPTTVKVRAQDRAALAPAAPRRAPPDAPTAGGEGVGVEPPGELSVAEETAREKFWKANLAELDFRRRSGELVDAGEMSAAIADAFARVRARILGIPTRARQQLPHLTAADVRLVDELLREALDELTVELGPAAPATVPGATGG